MAQQDVHFSWTAEGALSGGPLHTGGRVGADGLGGDTAGIQIVRGVSTPNWDSWRDKQSLLLKAASSLAQPAAKDLRATLTLCCCSTHRSQFSLLSSPAPEFVPSSWSPLHSKPPLMDLVCVQACKVLLIELSGIVTLGWNFLSKT